MKKYLLIIVIITSQFIESKAQKIGITGSLGLAKSKISGYDEFGTIDKKSILGYQFGPVVDFKLSGLFHLESGFVYSSKGYQLKYIFDYFGSSAESETFVRINYIELPILVSYAFEGMKIPILISAGPVLGVGLFGNIEIDSKVDSITNYENKRIVFGSESDEIKRMDLGFMFSGGVRLKSTDIKLYYNLGLINLLNEGEMRNRVFGIAISQWLFINK